MGARYLAFVPAVAVTLIAAAAAAGPVSAVSAQYSERQRRTLPEAWQGVDLPFAADEAIRAAGQRIARVHGGVEARADAIVDFIFSDSDGLQFTYRARPTLTASQAMAQRAGNCMSLVNLFLALGRSAELDVFPVEVDDFVSFSRSGPSVLRSGHVVGGLIVGARMWTFDFLPAQEKRYRRVHRISDVRLSALFFNAAAAEAMLAGDLDTADQLFRKALSLDENSADFWNNYALLARRQDDTETVLARLRRALELQEDNLPALNNLAATYRTTDRPDLAAQLEARALELENQNPYFLLSEATRRIDVQQLDAAEELLKRARRIDGSIPEVYLALGRIELARNEPARAEKLFETARQRSEALSEAFRHGLNSKIERLVQAAAER